MVRLQTISESSRSRPLALSFIVTAAGLYLVVGGLTYAAIRLIPASASAAEVSLPPVFWLTTPLLLLGSASLARASYFVRREKQRPFRRALLWSLTAGVLFVSLQASGLRSLILNQQPDEVETGANAFVTMLAALHAMHFTLALLFLIWVTVSAFHDRYDHEYSWGVTVCSWFWHALGIVWGIILVVFLICTQFPGATAEDHSRETSSPQGS